MKKGRKHSKKSVKMIRIALVVFLCLSMITLMFVLNPALFWSSLARLRTNIKTKAQYCKTSETVENHSCNPMDDKSFVHWNLQRFSYCNYYPNQDYRNENSFPCYT